MGQLRFLVPRLEQIESQAVARGYLSGMDELPWQTRTFWDGKQLVAERDDRDSGYFFIPWRSSFGAMALSTATLLEREEPYHLPVELARGTLNRLRNQRSVWESLGLIASTEIERQLRLGMERFCRAMLTQHIDVLAAADDAQAAIEAALQGMSLLTDDYVQQSVAARKRVHSRLPTLFGSVVDASLVADSNAQEFNEACDTACVPFVWGEIEREQGRYDWTQVDRYFAWCQSQGLRVCAGPLIQLTKTAAPAWIALWDGEFEHLLSFANAFIQAAIHRYRGKVALWQASSGLNSSRLLELNEEQLLQLAAYSLDTFRRADPRAPVILSIDQPWAEYMAHAEIELSPLQFADSLARLELGLAGIGLQMNFDFSAAGTLPRDWLEISRQLDRWTTLGLPLLVLPTMPDLGSNCAEAVQLAWLQRFLGVLLSKPAVQAIFWQRWQDDATADGPQNAGLVDIIGQPKRALKILKEFRQAHLI
ncbi:MAG TPA: endo-1,4-beta-xylanase [Pirellulales bacterium]|jgi:hypothetical protein|nr:endo-1,4-beta-xylanase [Pirellulales bacterium]